MISKGLTHKRDETKEHARKPSPTNMITKDYADIPVNQLLNTTESITILNARSKLRFYDQKLKDTGLRATVKIGIERIRSVM